MIRLSVAIFIFISNLSFAANAQERVVIGTQRLGENGALFLAAAQGYFKAEGIDLAMTAYDSDKAVAEMLASGAIHCRRVRCRRQGPDPGDCGTGAREARLRGQSDHRIEHRLSKGPAQVRQ